MENINYNLKDNTIQIVSDFKLTNVNDAMDLILSATFEFNCNNIVLSAENLDDSFFDLKTKFAGELLQKLVNYNCSIAIVGDFSVYDSKALKDFIFECNSLDNRGSRIFFVTDYEEAIKRLN